MNTGLCAWPTPLSSAAPRQRRNIDACIGRQRPIIGRCCGFTRLTTAQPFRTGWQPNVRGPRSGPARARTAKPLKVNADRREHHRYRTLDYVARLDSAGPHVLVRLRNLSSEGAMIAASTLPNVGDPVRLLFDCSRSIRGRVVWVSNGQAGIRFLKAVSCEGFIRGLVQSRFSSTARRLRVPVRIRGQLKCGAESVPTIVDDISQTGMRLGHQGGLVPGLQIEIALTGGICEHATVRWANEHFAGIELAGKIAIDDLNLLTTPTAQEERVRPETAQWPIKTD